jgi:hypothetical protein
MYFVVFVVLLAYLDAEASADQTTIVFDDLKLEGDW